MIPLFSNPKKWASEFAKGFSTPFKKAAQAAKKVGGGKKHTLPVKTVKKGKGKNGK